MVIKWTGAPQGCMALPHSDMHPMHISRKFIPTRTAALERLHAVEPRLGRAYAAGRNTDFGPDRQQAASILSPYLRHRLLLEREVALIAEQRHGPAAEKYVEEVFWRTYYKGWLESHPAAWDRFLTGLAHGENRLATESGLRRAHDDACNGHTGIDGFDDWAQELVETNWLHNHVRMWFASIWIFSLRLPWELGAAFFLRHLVDGDAASNTLSWRWVAGIHTAGKNYVARADNIARFTDGRYNPAGQLNESPEPLQEATAIPSARLPNPTPAPTGDVWLLLHDEDLCPEQLDLARCTVRGVAGLAGHPGIVPGVAAPVAAFAQDALKDGLDRAAAWYGVPSAGVLDPAAVGDWAGGTIVAPYAPVGPARSLLAAIPDVVPVLRPFDQAAWPHATKGYFGLRRYIPTMMG